MCASLFTRAYFLLLNLHEMILTVFDLIIKYGFSFFLLSPVLNTFLIQATLKCRNLIVVYIPDFVRAGICNFVKLFKTI